MDLSVQYPQSRSIFLRNAHFEEYKTTLHKPFLCAFETSTAGTSSLSEAIGQAISYHVAMAVRPIQVIHPICYASQPLYMQCQRADGDMWLCS